jgi:hypothetical protein
VPNPSLAATSAAHARTRFRYLVYSFLACIDTLCESNVEHWHMQLCWPFNTLVQTGSGYFLDFQAEDVVLDGLGFNVEDDTLTLFTTASMESAFPVMLVVSILSSLVLLMSNIALSWCC